MWRNWPVRCFTLKCAHTNNPIYLLRWFTRHNFRQLEQNGYNLAGLARSGGYLDTAKSPIAQEENQATSMNLS